MVAGRGHKICACCCIVTRPIHRLPFAHGSVGYITSPKPTATGRSLSVNFIAVATPPDSLCVCAGVTKLAKSP